jgi:hypothetical protein
VGIPPIATATTDALTAAGTLLSAVAAFLAVWVAVVLPRRRRPDLYIPIPEHDRELVEADLQLEGASDRVPSAFIRLAVHAEPDRDAAEEVEITILGARERRRREGYPPDPRDPMLAGLPLPVAASNGRITANIPAGGFRIFDLASTYKSPSGLAPLVIEVAPFAKPLDKRNEVKWGEAEIDLAVTAKNANGRRYKACIAYDGEWKPDIWQHLKLTSLTSLDPPRRRSLLTLGLTRTAENAETPDSSGVS